MPVVYRGPRRFGSPVFGPPGKVSTNQQTSQPTGQVASPVYNNFVDGGMYMDNTPYNLYAPFRIMTNANTKERGGSNRFRFRS